MWLAVSIMLVDEGRLLRTKPLALGGDMLGELDGRASGIGEMRIGKPSSVGGPSGNAR